MTLPSIRRIERATPPASTRPASAAACRPRWRRRWPPTRGRRRAIASPSPPRACSGAPRAKPTAEAAVALAAGNRTLLIRVALLGVAAIACAWFALGALQVHAQSRANALLPQNANVSPSVARVISHQLDRAGTLNPDRSVDILRAEVYIHAGNRPAAERLV